MRLFFAALTSVFFAGQVWASECITKPEPCPGPDALPIADDPYAFTYESWDKEPTSGGTLYRYGRCIENKQSKGILKVNWLEPQTSGSACPNRSVMTVISFLTKDTVLSPSLLYYGNAGDNRNVNYIAHALEQPIRDAELIAANEKATLAALNGANGTLQLDSDANISVAADGRGPTYSLVAVKMAFTSRLTRNSDGTLRYDYSFSYYTEPAVSEFDARVEDIRFGMDSKSFGEAMMNAGHKDTSVALRRQKGHLDVFLNSTASPRSTVTPVHFYDKRGEIVGTIPVSIFYPANIGP